MFSLIGLLITAGVIWGCVNLSLKQLSGAIGAGVILVTAYIVWTLSRCTGDCGIRIDFFAAVLLLGLMSIILLIRFLFSCSGTQKIIPATSIPISQKPDLHPHEFLKEFSVYTELVRDFVENRLPAKEFATAFSRQFEQEEHELSEDMFDILDWLIEEVRAFTDDPSLKKAKPDKYIDEAALREVAAQALLEMDALGQSASQTSSAP